MLTATAPRPTGPVRSVVLPCFLLFGAMLNLTLVVAALKELIIDELGGTVTDATLFFALETAAYILFAPLWGVLSDRLGRRRPLIVIGFLTSALIYAAYPRVSGLGAVLGLRFLQGACSVLGWSTAMALILDHCPPESRGRRMGAMGGSLILGVALGAPIGGYIARWRGPWAPLEAAAWSFLFIGLLALLLPPGGGAHRHQPLRAISVALRQRPRLLLPYAFHFVDRLTVGYFVVVFPLYLDSLGAADPALRGRYLAYFLLPFAFLQYPFGKLTERIGPYPPLLLGSALYGTVLCFVGSSSLFALRPVMVVLGILAALMFPPSLVLVARFSDAVTRGSAIGGFNLAGSLGFALGPLLGAWLFQLGGYGIAFAVSGALEVALAGAGFVLIRRWHPALPLSLATTGGEPR